MKITKIENNVGAVALDFEVPTTHSYILDGNILSHNSMKGILEYNEPKKNEQDGLEHVERHEAPTRPQELPCDIHEIKVQGEKWLVLVGKLNGSLYEVFVDKNTDGAVDVNHHKDGFIRKNGKGKYSLVIKNGTERVVVDNLAQEFDQTYGVLARFVSMSLRHGAPLQFIVKQLQKSKMFISFEKALSRVLKKYIKDGEVVQTGEVCPSCEGKNLVFQEGCLTCRDCSWSKCT